MGIGGIVVTGVADNFQNTPFYKAAASCLPVSLPNIFPYRQQDSTWKLPLTSLNQTKQLYQSNCLLLKLYTSELSVIVYSPISSSPRSFFQTGEDSVLVPFAYRIAMDLGPFLPAATDDTLGLVLQTLSAVVGVDKGRWITPELASSMIHAVLEIWRKNNRGI